MKIQLVFSITKLYLQIVFRDKNPGVYFEFTLPKETVEETIQYEWQLGEWSTCSVTCGGGEQSSIPVCHEIGKGVVAPSKCRVDLRPPNLQKACNLHSCPVR